MVNLFIFHNFRAVKIPHVFLFSMSITLNEIVVFIPGIWWFLVRGRRFVVPVKTTNSSDFKAILGGQFTHLEGEVEVPPGPKNASAAPTRNTKRRPGALGWSGTFLKKLRLPKKLKYIFGISHRIIYLHLPQKSTIHVGKYTSPTDPMGLAVPFIPSCWIFRYVMVYLATKAP